MEMITIPTLLVGVISGICGGVGFYIGLKIAPKYQDDNEEE